MRHSIQRFAFLLIFEFSRMPPFVLPLFWPLRLFSLLLRSVHSPPYLSAFLTSFSSQSESLSFLFVSVIVSRLYVFALPCLSFAFLRPTCESKGCKGNVKAKGKGGQNRRRFRRLSSRLATGAILSPSSLALSPVLLQLIVPPCPPRHHHPRPHPKAKPVPSSHSPPPTSTSPSEGASSPSRTRGNWRGLCWSWMRAGWRSYVSLASWSEIQGGGRGQDRGGEKGEAGNGRGYARKEGGDCANGNKGVP